MKKYLSILAALLCAASCIYPYDFELEEAPEGVLTVDADITIGETSTVRLGILYPLNLSSLPKVPDLYTAKVWVEDDANTVYAGELATSSTLPYINYYGYVTFTIPTENATSDRRYRLCVEALDATYASDWSEIPAPPVIRNIEFVPDPELVTVLVSVDGGEGGTGYLLLSYDETWEFHTDYVPHYKVDTRRWTIEEGDWDYSRYWCWARADNGRSYPVDYTGLSEQGVTAWPLYAFPRRDGRNHKKYCVRVRAKTLSSSSYRFLKNLEDNTDGGDNLFTPNPGEIPGNIRCETDPDRQVYGYALFSRTVSKRAFLNNRYYLSPGLAPLNYLIWDQYADFWSMGYRPLAENPNPDHDPEQEGPYGWGAPRCYDCTAAGGTLQKPSFWDEDL